MFLYDSGYTQLSRIIIASFVGIFGIFTVCTYFLIKKNISDETEAAMFQAKTIQQSQVSIDNVEKILSGSPHLKVERFFGRLNTDISSQINTDKIDTTSNIIKPIVLPLSENSFLIISPDNDTELSQNLLFFYLVAVLFLLTLGLLLIIIRLGIAHQLKPLKTLASALQHTIKGDHVDISRNIILPRSELHEIQSVFDEYSMLKQQLIDNELALVKANRQLAMLQEQERSYLARELHDNVGQLLTSAKAYAHMLTNTDDKQVINHSGIKIQTFCADIGNAIRELTQHLHPIIFDKVTLWEAVHILVIEQQDITPKINWQLNICSKTFVAKKERDIHLYRIIQESVNNIIKHSNAKHASLNVRIDNEMLQLDIIDDGIGLGHVKQPQTLGLSNIKTRARCIGADLSFSSHNGVGTKISIIVNIKDEEFSL